MIVTSCKSDKVERFYKVLKFRPIKLNSLLLTGQIKAAELCEHCLQQAKKLRHLNMYITESEEMARQQAKESDLRFENGNSHGLLDGIPFAAKDNFCTDGLQTSCASEMLRGYKPVYNATVVQRFYDHGALLIGKANMDEFAMGCGSIDSCFGAVRSPWQGTDTDDDDWHIAGGSSGGSACAVATGTVMAALGSDTGGSARNPASYCGVVALKPSYGLLSRHGLIPLVNSLDCPSIFTRTVDDCAIVLNHLCGVDNKDSTSVAAPHSPFVNLSDEPTIKGLKVGIPQEYFTPELSPDTHSLWCSVADKMSDAGAEVISVSLPHTLYSLICYSVICACEVASNQARYDGIEYGLRSSNNQSTESLYAATRHDGFNDVVRGRILAGNYFLLKKNYDKHFKQAQRVRRLICEDFDQVYRSGVDVLLTPTVLGDAPKYSEFSQADNRTRTMEQDVYTQAANMAGIPGVTVPTALSSRGLPIGLQLLGQRLREDRLLLVAKWLEQQVDFPYLDMSRLDNESINDIRKRQDNL